MKKNNFLIAMIFGIISLVGTSFELRSSEKSGLVPKEKSDNPSPKKRLILNDYEQQRKVRVQQSVTKNTEKTLASYIMDDYAGECRKKNEENPMNTGF